MAVLGGIILLINIFVGVYAQFPNANVPPGRPGTSITSKPRYQRLQNPRVGPEAHRIRSSIIGSTQLRRPVLPTNNQHRANPAFSADTPEYPSFVNARPRIVQHGFPLTLEKEQHDPKVTEQSQEREKTKQQRPLQQESAIKPVSEETAEDEDEVADRAIANISADSNLPQQSGNLVSGPLTPKPDFGPIQYRGAPSPVPLVAKPLIVPREENIAPTRYRSQKVTKIRKPATIEDVRVDEVRAPARQQIQPQEHQRNPVIKVTQSRLSDTREKYPEPRRDEYSSSATRNKKPVAQIIRRWREDNPDGSITWGFENDDGSYKEELIGVDCITRGKYGYIDLDGFRREYSYVTGIECDEEQQEEEKENGFVDYQENKLVLPNGKTIDLSAMGKKQARRPRPIYTT